MFIPIESLHLRLLTLIGKEPGRYAALTFFVCEHNKQKSFGGPC